MFGDFIGETEKMLHTIYAQHIRQPNWGAPSLACGVDVGWHHMRLLWPGHQLLDISKEAIAARSLFFCQHIQVEEGLSHVAYETYEGRAD